MILNKSPHLKLLFDARMIAHSGIGRYINNLLTQFVQMDMDPFEIILAGNPALLQSFAGYPQIKIHPFISSVYSPQELIQWQIILKKTQPDLLHVPHYNTPVFPGSKMVANIHDLLHWKYPETIRNPLGRYYSKIRFKRTIQQSDVLLTLTQTIKNELGDEFSGINHKVEAIYPGIPAFIEPLANGPMNQKILDKYHIISPYFLFVGIDKPHKNLTRLIEAFGKVKTLLNEPVQLVITGNHDVSLFNMPEGSSIIKTGQIPDDELSILYKKALALISPSLSEGFGFTPFEGFIHGIPSAVSDIPVYHEVCKDSVLYFNPIDTDQMASVMIRLSKEKSLRSELITKGSRQMREYSWNQTARKTLEVYRKLLIGGPARGFR